jgi:hypothetical protein
MRQLRSLQVQVESIKFYTTLHYFQNCLPPKGIASKYWDAEATSERATKKRAKEKLAALNVEEETTTGSAMFHQCPSIFSTHYKFCD